MRAAVQVGYGSSDTSLLVREVTTPRAGPGEVLVRVAGSTLNRKDLFALANLTGPGIRARPPLPHVNGTDAWGTVVAAGEGVDGWHPGERVVVYPGLYCAACEFCVRGETSACTTYGVIGEQCWGGHAEFITVPPRNLERIPEGLGPEALACVGGSWLTAWRALISVASIRTGETVLVVGASGGVGTAAIQIARAAGCRVIAAVGTQWKARRAMESGADAVVMADEPLKESVMALTTGRGVDVAIDSVGGAGWRDTIGALVPLGRMAVCGATAGDAPSISIREIYQSHRRILGAPLGTRAEFTALLRAFAAGRLAPVVHAVVPLERIHEGLRLLERREIFGKIAVAIGEA
ncbi:MAG: zinc-binding dehydrogenase [Gemmatimonadales bacterium]|nr:zinc-binding dehydrogenase [Gemmatimonadales bacterium]